MLSSSLSCVGSERSLFPCALWYQEPVKNEEPVKRQAAPVTVGSTAPAAPMMPGYQTYVQSPYQNLGMQTYPFMGGAA